MSKQKFWLPTLMDGKYTFKYDELVLYMQRKNLLALAAMPAELKGCDHGHAH